MRFFHATRMETVLFFLLLSFFPVSLVFSRETPSISSEHLPARSATAAERENYSKILEEIKLLPTTDLKVSQGLQLLERQARDSDTAGLKQTSDFLIGCCAELKNVFARDEVYGKMAYLHNQKGDFSGAVDLVRCISGDLKIRATILFGILNQRIALDLPVKPISFSRPDHETQRPTIHAEPLSLTSGEFVLLMKKIVDDAIREKEYAVQYAAYVLFGRHLIAEGSVLEGIEMFQNAIHAAGQLEIFETRGAVGAIMGTFARSLLEAKADTSPLDVYKKLENADLKNEALTSIVYTFISYDDFPSAKTYFSRIEEKEVRDKLVPVYLDLFSRNENTESLAGEIARLAQDDEGTMCNLKFALGSIHASRGEYSQALKIARDFTETLEQENLRTNLLLKIVDQAMRAGEFQSARDAAENIRPGEQKTAVLRHLATFVLRKEERDQMELLVESTFSEEERAEIAELETVRGTLESSTDDVEQRLGEASNLLARELQLGNVFGARTTLVLLGEIAGDISDTAKKVGTIMTAVDGLMRLGGKDEALTMLETYRDVIDDAPGEVRLRYLHNLLVLEKDARNEGGTADALDRIHAVLRVVEKPDLREFQTLAAILATTGGIGEIEVDSELYRTALRWIELDKSVEQKLTLRFLLADALAAARREKENHANNR